MASNCINFGYVKYELGAVKIVYTLEGGGDLFHMGEGCLWFILSIEHTTLFEMLNRTAYNKHYLHVHQDE